MSEWNITSNIEIKRIIRGGAHTNEIKSLNIANGIART